MFFYPDCFLDGQPLQRHEATVSNTAANIMPPAFKAVVINKLLPGQSVCAIILHT
jgi:hypothetical protein